MRISSLEIALIVGTVAALTSCGDETTFTPPGAVTAGTGGTNTAGTAGTGTNAGSGGTGQGTAGSGAQPSAGSGGQPSAGTGGTGEGGSETTAGTGGTDPSPAGCEGDCTAIFQGDQFDGFLIEDNPTQVQGSDGIQGPGTSGQVCTPTAGRPDRGLLFKEGHFQLSGPGIMEGVEYDVTVHVTGVVECKDYITNGCPEAENTGRSGVYNMWCPGAEDNGDVWNTFMISVTDEESSTTPGMGPQDQGPMPSLDNVYMLNQCPQDESVSHKTWKIDYDATFTVTGGQWINFVEFDTNCRQIINCGPSNDSGITCNEQFVLSVPTSVPAAPDELVGATEPFAEGGGGFGQWLYFDVRAVVPR